MRLFAVLPLLALAPALAQDTRRVVEPSIPAVCATLKAQLPAALSDADEAKLDTARIQQAIDRCTKGAVVIDRDGAQRAFLSGPLQLRNGTTLVINAGAILYASSNPSDYDTIPNRCGTTGNDGKGCKPLIAADGVSNAAIMGAGTIDGRGGAKLIDAGFS